MPYFKVLDRSSESPLDYTVITAPRGRIMFLEAQYDGCNVHRYFVRLTDNISYEISVEDYLRLAMEILEDEKCTGT